MEARKWVHVLHREVGAQSNTCTGIDNSSKSIEILDTFRTLVSRINQLARVDEFTRNDKPVVVPRTTCRLHYNKAPSECLKGVQELCLRMGWLDACDHWKLVLHSGLDDDPIKGLTSKLCETSSIIRPDNLCMLNPRANQESSGFCLIFQCRLNYVQDYRVCPISDGVDVLFSNFN